MRIGRNYANGNGEDYRAFLEERAADFGIDPVWHYFNSEKPYTFKKDIKMKISTLSGLDPQLRPEFRQEIKKNYYPSIKPMLVKQLSDVVISQ